MGFRDLEGEVVSAGANSLTLGKLLDEGAEGGVYRIKGNSDSVVKIFKEDCRTSKGKKIPAMISERPKDPTHDDKGIRSIIWPEEIVERASGEFLGYTMPYLEIDQYCNARRYAREELSWNSSSHEERYGVALNLAYAIASIHFQGHAIGDLNHQNILIRDGYVSLIDCDSFHIDGNSGTYPGEKVFGRYSPPGGRGRNTLKDVRQADLFGLGIHIFQFLMEGFHPYQAQGSDAAGGNFIEAIKENDFPYKDPKPGRLEPHSAVDGKYDQLPDGVKEKFEECFVVGKARGRYRPTASDWVKALNEAGGFSDQISIGTSSGNSSTKSPTGSSPKSPSINPQNEDRLETLEDKWGDRRKDSQSSEKGNTQSTRSTSQSQEDDRLEQLEEQWDDRQNTSQSGTSTRSSTGTNGGGSDEEDRLENLEDKWSNRRGNSQSSTQNPNGSGSTSNQAGDGDRLDQLEDKWDKRRDEDSPPGGTQSASSENTESPSDWVNDIRENNDEDKNEN
ncbi:hypothetical protein [Haloarcula sp. Atlit-120R]|uniref:hypothetical protein n=1 Tax=Haloarcula sp. Atlit-120R TaxID=2282135 RepID=UPI0011C36AEE|nr:hypothetical protein [Haloarcula sp. Atlit-120R]